MKQPHKVLYLVLLGLGISISTARAQGTFTATGNMNVARSGHTATLLTDGRVLIAGGCYAPCGPGVTSTAELYDPGTGTFTATGSMISARVGHTATLLPDGRVLIAGGCITSCGPAGTATTELYDPATGTFAAASKMTMAVTHGVTLATLLPNGFVLITGADAELYDPVMRTFTSVGDITVLNGFATSTLLADGRVLLTSYYGATELFDPRTCTFDRTSYLFGLSLFTDRATLLANGKVLIAGGDADPGPAANAEVFDPSTEVFTDIGGMTAARSGHTMTLLPDGKALITGGSSYDALYYYCCLSSTELYDPLTGLFAATGSMAVGRSGHTATLLNNGEVLIAGGYASFSNFLTGAELYHPEAPIPAPALFSLSGNGEGQGAIQHAGTPRIASADDPAVAGEYLSIYLTGLADGSVIPPQLAIGGKAAEITFFGNVPGYPGLNVVNIRMPAGVAAGAAVPVRLTYIGRPSNQVTMGVTEVVLQEAATAMKTAAGTDSLNFWQWAWFWQYLPAFNGAPAGFGVGGSISPDVMEQIVTAGGGDPLQSISADRWVLDFRRVVPQ